VRILLPPSEAKHPGGRGSPLATRRAPAKLAEHYGELARHRGELLAALARLLDQPGAAEALLLPPSVAAPALATNRRVAAAPTLPAMHRYAGTLYQGLDVAGLSAPAVRLARTDLLIFSGLLGVSRGGDPVPDYRVPAKAVLPGLGIAATFWRPRLARLLPALLGRGPVVDLRSTDYAAMWQPASSEAERLIAVRVLSPTPAGRLAVVSYRSKLAKGRLAAALLERQAAGRPVNGPEDLLAAWSELGGLTGSARTTGRGTVLELREAALPTPA
jgi:cytoplasmic iron level regulating protein YaaA (DUF328/UPF0246 family)